MSLPPASARTVYAVSELAETLRGLIENALPRVWVQGEISNLARPASGHWYFTLKDARAQLRTVMFRNANLHVRPPPKDGDQVLVRGQISIYTARGDLQLICEHMEPAGQGALLQAFEQLKARLAAESLFDENWTRPLPALPRAIGLITSGSGAALHDIVSTLSRRYPLAPVLLLPVPVQGVEAPPAIVRALRELPARAAVDVIILARGGGSLEDLWAFNDEQVARAIRACAVPVITGIGHEIDFTIADFAADLRAPTPTAAAERVAPDIADWRERLRQQALRLEVAAQRQLRNGQQRLQQAERRLQTQHPGRRLQDRAQRLDELSLRLERAGHTQLRRAGERLRHTQAQLSQRNPSTRIQQQRRQLDSLQLRLAAGLRQGLAQAQARLAQQSSVLHSLNPRAVLERGYAIALDQQGRAVTDATAAHAGDALRVVLARGALDTRIEHISPDD